MVNTLDCHDGWEPSRNDIFDPPPAPPPEGDKRVSVKIKVVKQKIRSLEELEALEELAS